MKIVTYPHPTLRHVSKPVRRVDAQLRQTIAHMFDLMYEARGVGLAANQVDLPLRLFVVNLAAQPGEGEELVFLNPVISRPKGSAEQEEGCLSIPGVFGIVRRPEKIHFQAYTLAGEEINLEADGLLARVLQHETDHLNGVLFTDRLGPSQQLQAEGPLLEFELAFRSQRKCGEMPSDEEIAQRLQELENQYC